MANVHIFDQKEFYSRLAEAIAKAAKESIKASDRFTVALSGGTTPIGLYEEIVKGGHLTEKEIAKTYFFFGDERDVSPESARSNFKLAKDLLFKPLKVKIPNIIRWPTEIINAAEVAVKYDQAIRRFFRLEEGEFPRFDLVILGLGDDCHTASLFPNTEALKEESRIAVMNRVEKLDTNRLTLTFPAINNSKRIFFAVTGSKKAEALREAIEGKRNCSRFPAQCIEPNDGEVVWFADKEAASALSKKVSKAGKR
ncbi:MAG: 6-phosphogluconolactonase [Acidobacteria bacterium]|nr:MAG: 6-phosphogluconolactonase [Acidobacteriota bacterium]REK01214.1 MAG: 6-phosphogluconolactonase [Acidobacteriota bacterium]REK14170.1 MAG: 6-phosphogluconolactonase [Acidobacteriota bacterium]REK44885.1 MAG: 6-phosphogluconolactonase [Acidobacteriota bacterium]